MTKKEKRKGGKSPKRITMLLKRTDDVWYAILQYRTLNINYIHSTEHSTTKKYFQKNKNFHSPSVGKLQPYI